MDNHHLNHHGSHHRRPKRSLPSYLICGLIRAYQLAIRPFLGDVCRFYPTCSAYALEAIQKRGCLKGVWLTTKRLLKCHPWHPGGIDPVP